MNNKRSQKVLSLARLQTVIAEMESNRINNLNFYPEITAIQRIALAFDKQQKDYLLAISRTNDLMKAVTAPIPTFNSSAILAANLWTTEFSKVQSPLLGLTASLTKIFQSNKLWADKLSNIETSQLRLTLSLQTAFNIHSQHKIAFGHLNIAIPYISLDFLKQIAITKTWEDIDSVEEANKIISDAINATCEEEYVRSISDDSEKIKEFIISKLSKLLHNTKTQRAKDYILELINAISIILSIYSFITTPTQNDIRQIVKQEVTANNNVRTDEIERPVSRYFSKMRIARRNVKLLYADKKNAKVIGIVKRGQGVTIIEIRHKYLWISFIDEETGEPKSGFVLKKGFISIHNKFCDTIN